MSIDAFKRFYAPTCEGAWEGREDDVRFHSIVRCVDFSPLDPQNPFGEDRPDTVVVLTGFACDLGVKRNLGRPGAKGGPTAFRKALSQLPVHFDERKTQIIDVGDIVSPATETLPDSPILEDVQNALSSLVAYAIQRLQAFVGHKRVLSLVIGGGHEVAVAHYRGLQMAREHSQQTKWLVFNYDAHLDMRVPSPLPSSGTSFLQMYSDETLTPPHRYTCIGCQATLGNTRKVLQKATENRVRVIPAGVQDLWFGGCASDVLGGGDCGTRASNSIATTLSEVAGTSNKDVPLAIYTSVCMDVFSVAIAPGVSAPQPCGLSSSDVLSPLVHTARISSNLYNGENAEPLLAGMDIAELAPELDEKDGRTSKLAAAVASTYIHAAVPSKC